MIFDYRNGRNLASRSRGVKVIDLYGLSEAEVRDRHPAVYQHVLDALAGIGMARRLKDGRYAA